MANVERYSWNVQINGVVYLVEYMKGSVYINGGEAFKLRSLEYKRKFIPSRMSYTVPLAGKELTLVIGQIDGVVLFKSRINAFNPVNHIGLSRQNISALQTVFHTFRIFI